ncbi:MAG: hypothetical protein WCG47_01355 [Dermatophilaceae bacterium]
MATPQSGGTLGILGGGLPPDLRRRDRAQLSVLIARPGIAGRRPGEHRDRSAGRAGLPRGAAAALGNHRVVDLAGTGSPDGQQPVVGLQGTVELPLTGGLLSALGRIRDCHRGGARTRPGVRAGS